jgi:Tol biopolymer transport system component
LPSKLIFLVLLVLSFSHVLTAQNARADGIRGSQIKIYDFRTGEAEVVYETGDLIEAPNWTPDGNYLIFNGSGSLFRISAEGGKPDRIDTGDITAINNDHGISPDGMWLIITADRPPQIFVLPEAGGQPRQVTTLAPSFWHGIAPDGNTLAYVARRNDQFDLFTIPTAGGEEVQLTDDAAHDDGPDYSPDGRYIYWNSDRDGDFNIWRIPAQGGQAERVTSDDMEDWFPHPSPDGKRMVMLSYPPGTEGHPANLRVKLRVMDLPDGEPRDLLELFGGQGTINVPSWAPDSQRFAFVEYLER